MRRVSAVDLVASRVSSRKNSSAPNTSVVATIQHSATTVPSGGRTNALTKVSATTTQISSPAAVLRLIARCACQRRWRSTGSSSISLLGTFDSTARSSTWTRSTSQVSRWFITLRNAPIAARKNAGVSDSCTTCCTRTVLEVRCSSSPARLVVAERMSISRGLVASRRVLKRSRPHVDRRWRILHVDRRSVFDAHTLDRTGQAAEVVPERGQRQDSDQHAHRQERAGQNRNRL